MVHIVHLTPLDARRPGEYGPAWVEADKRQCAALGAGGLTGDKRVAGAASGRLAGEENACRN